MVWWRRWLVMAIVLCLWACGGGGGGGAEGVGALSAGPSVSTVETPIDNVIPVSVGLGVAGVTTFYPNQSFVSLQICVPGTSNCAILDKVLLDTGSIGLRVFDHGVTTQDAFKKLSNHANSSRIGQLRFFASLRKRSSGLVTTGLLTCSSSGKSFMESE